MNLWAKSLRQLLVIAVALFFFSCEDENSFLGFRNPKPKFNVYFVDIPLESSAQLIDSIITDNKGSAGSTLIGTYTDPDFGKVRTTSYLQILPIGSAKIAETAQVDSVVAQVRLSFYAYGFTGERTEKFTVHELLQPMDRTIVKRYRYNENIPYSAEAMDEASVTVKYDSLIKQYGTDPKERDTLLATARLSQSMADQIMLLCKAYPFDEPEQTADFINQVRGIALVPSVSDGVLGLSILDGLSRVTMYYRTFDSNGAVQDTVQRIFNFGGPSFTNIDIDRTSTAFSGYQPFQSISPTSTSGLRYIQSGSAAVTKLDLRKFYEFADTVDNIVINEAALVIDGVEQQAGFLPHSKLALRAMNENNWFTNVNVDEDSAMVRPYAFTSVNATGTLVLDVENFTVRSDLPTNPPSIASIDYSDGKYKGYLTLFTQQLVKYKNDDSGIRDTRLRYLGLYPLSPSVSTTVTRTKFDAGTVHLRVYYTKPTLNTEL